MRLTPSQIQALREGAKFVDVDDIVRCLLEERDELRAALERIRLRCHGPSAFMGNEIHRIADDTLTGTPGDGG